MEAGVPINPDLLNIDDAGKSCDPQWMLKAAANSLIRFALFPALFLPAGQVLASSSTASAEGFNPKPLDEVMLKACVSVSAQSACQGRLSEIRKGLDVTAIMSLAPQLKIDSKIRLALVSDPLRMISQYYCLATFNSLIPANDFGMDLFAYAVKGLSYGTVSAQPYRHWLKSGASKACRDEIGRAGLKPEPVSSDRDYQIVLNPVTYFEFGAEDDFFDAAVTTYNHERLHAVFADEKAESKVLKLWSQLTDGQQVQFKQEHASYDFSNKKVLAREFFSYLFEKQPAKAYEFLSGKFGGRKFADLQKALCQHCVNGDASLLEKARALSELSPKGLLERIEKEGIKVLILSSGRKNPSPLFSWGKVRIDPGQLNQLTKLEGAMGKTLCRGEKPESKDGITIVLAADSSFSTLIHEYLHVQQILRDRSWCPVSRQLWGADSVSPQETRMIRDREWDVRLVLWELLRAPQMSVEDRLVVTDGLIREGLMREDFDPAAAAWIQTHDLKAQREKAVVEYQAILGGKGSN